MGEPGWTSGVWPWSRALTARTEEAVCGAEVLVNVVGVNPGAVLEP